MSGSTTSRVSIRAMGFSVCCCPCCPSGLRPDWANVVIGRQKKRKAKGKRQKAKGNGFVIQRFSLRNSFNGSVRIPPAGAGGSFRLCSAFREAEDFCLLPFAF